MRITQSQLRKIIKEELEFVINEDRFDTQTGKLLNFDTSTGEPITKEAELKCAQNARCYEKFVAPIIAQNTKFSTRTGGPMDQVKAAAQKAGFYKPQAQAAGSTAAEIDQQIDALKQEFRKQLAKDPNNREEYSAEFKKQIRALAQKKAAAQR